MAVFYMFMLYLIFGSFCLSAWICYFARFWIGKIDFYDFCYLFCRFLFLFIGFFLFYFFYFVYLIELLSVFYPLDFIFRFIYLLFRFSWLLGLSISTVWKHSSLLYSWFIILFSSFPFFFYYFYTYFYFYKL